MGQSVHAMGLSAGWRARAGLALALAAALAACGKKGPPLAPFVRLPAAAQQFSAKRMGATVYLRFVVPAKNQDNSTPADVSRVNVYGFTGKPRNDEELVKYGTLVASVPVRPPPPPEDEDRPPRTGPGKEQPPRASARPVEPEPGFDQGATVTVTETLTQPLFQLAVVAPRKQPKRPARVEPPVLLPVASFDELPARVYVAVGINHKGRRGTFSPHVAVPLVNQPPPPSALTVTYTETALTVAWTPPRGAPLPPTPFIAKTKSSTTDSTTLVGRPIVPLAAPAWSYDVFQVPSLKQAGDAAGSMPARPPLAPVDVPAPLNPKPLTAATFTDTRMEFGAERCYAVRTINVFGGIQHESEPSEVACVTPRDTFPPAAPTGLIAVATAGAINLNWQANTEGDLAGYLVLRAEAPGGALRPLMARPIAETTYEDRTVTSGVRYVYAVVSVDKATPANVSAQSNRIEETAR